MLMSIEAHTFLKFTRVFIWTELGSKVEEALFLVILATLVRLIAHAPVTRLDVTAYITIAILFIYLVKYPALRASPLFRYFFELEHLVGCDRVFVLEVLIEALINQGLKLVSFELLIDIQLRI